MRTLLTGSHDSCTFNLRADQPDHHLHADRAGRPRRHRRCRRISPADACVRTVTGTLGLTPRTARLLAVDWLPAGGHGDTVVFVFDAGTLESDEPEQLLFDPAHLIGWQLADPADLYRLDPPEKRRTEAAVRARTTGETVYLERGRPPA
jgi:hypothetical protein